jgi:hypothetical protein
MSQTIKIYVISHNEEDIKKVRNDDLYVPLLVGCDGKNNLGFCSDDTGDNISKKNNSYCELTGLYWIWKNSKSDIVGLVHYRRYFSKNKYSKNYLEKEDIGDYLKNNDIILPNPDKSLLDNVYNDYSLWNYSKDMDLSREAIEKLYPEYIPSFDKIMGSNKLYYYNMFISKKEIIDQYCEWLFPILKYVEKNVDLSDYDNYQKRIYGFLSERLFNVWIDYHNLKIKEVDFRSLGLMLNIKMFIKKRTIIRKIYTKLYLNIIKKNNL